MRVLQARVRVDFRITVIEKYSRLCRHAGSGILTPRYGRERRVGDPSAPCFSVSRVIREITDEWGHNKRGEIVGLVEVFDRARR